MANNARKKEGKEGEGREEGGRDPQGIREGVEEVAMKGEGDV